MKKIRLDNIFDYYEHSIEFGDAKALRKILFFMKSEGCRFAYKSSVDNDEEYLAECTSLTKRHDPLIRFDFFKNKDINEKNYLGYIQIRPSNKDWPINDAFLKTPEANFHPLSYFITCKTQYTTQAPITSTPLNISGVFFAQRDGKLGQCAHACLRMLSYYHNKLLTIPQIKEIAREERLESNGLEIEPHVNNVLDALGLHYMPYNPPFIIKIKTPKGDKELPFTSEDIIYTYVESRIPVLVVLDTKKSPHMILVVGHTFDPHAWWPEAHERYYQSLPHGSYLKSSSWANFICHDDNFGPYLSFPRELQVKLGPTVDLPEGSLHDKEATRKQGEPFSDGIYTIIVPSPIPLGLRAELVNPLIYGMFWDEFIGDHIRSVNSRWADCFLRHFEEGKLLLRTFLITKKEFLERVKKPKNEMAQQVKNFYQDQRLFSPPDRFWITEISVPEIFSQEKYCLGEVITDPNPSFILTPENIYALKMQKTNQIVKYIHVPGTLIANHKEKQWVLHIENDMPYSHTIHS